MLHRLINISKSNSFFLFGARGTGKSTIVNHLFQPEQNTEVLKIDLLEFQELERILENPDSIESRLTPTTKWVILDEIQKAPKALDTVHRLIESRGIKFALTGSSSRKLKAGGANLLAGRAFVYELYPFAQRELQKSFDLIEVLKWGSLPGVYSFDEDQDKKLFLEAYARTYLKEEIWEEQLVKNLNPFRKFLQVAAQTSGTVVNYSNIAKDVGVDTKTVQSYFQILEDTLLSVSLEQFHNSPRKRLRSNPKFYLFDLGVTRALTRDFAIEYSPQSLGFGYRFEQFIILEAIRLNSYSGRNYEFSFINNKDDKEVDLVVDRPGKALALVEIKSTDNIQESHIEDLEYFLPHFHDAEFFCLSRDRQEKYFGRIRCLHWIEGLRALGL